jgi:hypothetical protein
MILSKGAILILEFKHIDLSDKPIFDDFFNERDYHAAECCFGTAFIWRGCYDTYWAVCHGSLILKVTVGGKTFVLPPYGARDEDLPLILQSLKEYFGGQPFEIHGIYESTKERFARVFPEITDYVDDRDNWDYVYDRDKLATLSGRKYHGKKNHYNAFVKDYPDFVYEEITRANKDECIAFGQKWCAIREETDPTIKCEYCAIQEALNNMEFLKIRGGLIRLNGEVKAFSFGEKVSEHTAVIHVEKADPDIRGLYTAINKEFVDRAWKDVLYINREEDMGKEGLRKAKESYHPAFMVKKYNTVIR